MRVLWRDLEHFWKSKFYPSLTPIVSLTGFVYQNKCWKRGSSYGTLWASKLGSVGGLHIKLFSHLQWILRIVHTVVIKLVLPCVSQCQGASKTGSICDVRVPAELWHIYKGSLKGNGSLLNAWVEVLLCTSQIYTWGGLYLSRSEKKATFSFYSSLTIYNRWAMQRKELNKKAVTHYW